MHGILKILTCLLFSLLCQQAISQASLDIEVRDIRSEKGTILISVFTAEDQFPRNALPEFKDIKLVKNNMKDGVLVYKLSNIVPGKYAVALLDDENNSGEMDYKRLGIPDEGFGFSNNAKPLLSEPPYKKCEFEVKAGKNKISIQVRYR